MSAAATDLHEASGAVAQAAEHLEGARQALKAARLATASPVAAVSASAILSAARAVPRLAGAIVGVRRAADRAEAAALEGTNRAHSAGRLPAGDLVAVAQIEAGIARDVATWTREEMAARLEAVATRGERAEVYATLAAAGARIRREALDDEATTTALERLVWAWRGTGAKHLAASAAELARAADAARGEASEAEAALAFEREREQAGHALAAARRAFDDAKAALDVARRGLKAAEDEAARFTTTGDARLSA